MPTMRPVAGRSERTPRPCRSRGNATRAGEIGLGRLAWTLAACLVAGCGPDDRVALTADDDNLDSLALRGDSVVALARRGFTAADSASALAQGAQRARDALRAGTVSATDAPPAGAVASPGDAAPGDTAPVREVVVGTRSALPPRTPPAEPPRPVTGGTLAPAAGARGTGSDTLRGLIAVVGSAPMTQVVVTPPGGGQVALNGMAAGELGALGGAEVMVRGVRTSPRELVVADYAVRAVDGVAATDGMLIATGDGLVLQARDGTRRTVRNAPAELRALVGTRVWIAGSLERPVSFGRIRRGR
jgi:hypothetical protein